MILNIVAVESQSSLLLQELKLGSSCSFSQSLSSMNSMNALRSNCCPFPSWVWLSLGLQSWTGKAVFCFSQIRLLVPCGGTWHWTSHTLSWCILPFSCAFIRSWPLSSSPLLLCPKHKFYNSYCLPNLCIYLLHYFVFLLVCWAGVSVSKHF